MFYNDNDKKSAILAVLLSLALLVLVSCGKQMKENTLDGDAHEVAFRIYEAAGEDSSRVLEQSVDAGNSYMLGISEDEFEEKALEGALFYPSAVSMGKTLSVIVARDEACAEQLYEYLYENYDWAPCDPADNMAFMLFGRYIVTVKDEREETEKLCRAFSSIAQGDATVRYSENPM
ncbi:MAG: hypothetical protein E7608_00375 [Ruminococcaceae bacterium]|nr:hypothetical protein [Oscillospiraceae bacterium]